MTNNWQKQQRGVAPPLPWASRAFVVRVLNSGTRFFLETTIFGGPSWWLTKIPKKTMTNQILKMAKLVDGRLQTFINTNDFGSTILTSLFLLQEQ